MCEVIFLDPTGSLRNNLNDNNGNDRKENRSTHPKNNHLPSDLVGPAEIASKHQPLSEAQQELMSVVDAMAQGLGGTGSAEIHWDGVKAAISQLGALEGFELVNSQIMSSDLNDVSNIDDIRNLWKDWSYGPYGGMYGVRSIELASMSGVSSSVGRAGLGLSSLLRGASAVPKNNIVVLGSHPQYLALADELNARRFSLPASVWKNLTPSEQWTANKRFLDLAIKRGDEFRLSDPASSAQRGTFFHREIEYLKSNGYRVSEDGMQMFLEN